jgi:hypothetical protein
MANLGGYSEGTGAVDGGMTVRTLLGASGVTQRESTAGNYVEELLARLGKPEHYVEVHMYPTRAEMIGALTRELESSAPGRSFVVPEFDTFHEAFAGYPRIWISSADVDQSGHPTVGDLVISAGYLAKPARHG